MCYRDPKPYTLNPKQAKLWIQAEECSKFTDVQIEFTDGTQLRAHRCILTLASSCFERMFNIGACATYMLHAVCYIHAACGVLQTLNPKP